MDGIRSNQRHAHVSGLPNLWTDTVSAVGSHLLQERGGVEFRPLAFLLDGDLAQGPIQAHGGGDQGQVGEGVREVAKSLSGSS